jgi:hypothetical protein
VALAVGLENDHGLAAVTLSIGLAASILASARSKRLAERGGVEGGRHLHNRVRLLRTKKSLPERAFNI